MSESIEVVTQDDLRRAQLDSLVTAQQAQIDAEVAQFAAIHALCTLYDAPDVDQFYPVLVERGVRGGHDGTPEVSEFLCLEIGAALGISPISAARRIMQVLDLVHRHPELHREVLARRVRLWQASAITAETAAAGLTGEAARWVDHRIAHRVARLPFGRVMRLVKGLIAQADPALAAERAEAAAERRRVRIDRQSLLGVAEVSATVSVLDGQLLETTLRMLARQLAEQGDTDALDVRRAKALGVLATPARALAMLKQHPDYSRHLVETGVDLPSEPIDLSTVPGPAVSLVVHCSAESLLGSVGTSAMCDPAAAVARVEGLDAALVARLGEMFAGSTVVVRPVVDLNATPAVDTLRFQHARVRQSPSACRSMPSRSAACPPRRAISTTSSPTGEKDHPGRRGSPISRRCRDEPTGPRPWGCGATC